MCIRPKSIALLGYYGGGNLGNEGLLLAMLTFLRKAFPGASISAICCFPAGVTENYSIPAVSIFPSLPQWVQLKRSSIGRFFYRLFIRLPLEIPIWLKTFHHLRTVDLVIIPGTGMLSDYRQEPFAVPSCLFRWCLSARLLNIPVLFVSVSAGPIRNPLSRLFLTAAARIAAYRSYRDKVSRDYMKRVGINVVKDLVYPDLVFNLPHPRSTVPESVKTARKPTTVGLGVMTYYGWRFNEILSKTLYETYIGKLTRFVQWLLKHEYNVRLLIGEDSDHKAANDLLKNIQTDLGMGTKYGITYEPARTIYDVLRQVSETDIVVASRFHNIVCALMLNKPVLSLSYAEKNDALMAEMGLAEYCQHIEKFDVELLVKQFEEVVRNSSRIAQGICEKNREYRKSLDRQFDEIFARLNPNVAQKRIWADKKAS